MSTEPFKSYEQALMNDPLHYRCQKAGFTKDHTLMLMANRHQELLAELTSVKIIAPRKVRLPDGSVAIWRCPDNLIPEPPLDEH